MLHRGIATHPVDQQISVTGWQVFVARWHFMSPSWQL